MNELKKTIAALIELASKIIDELDQDEIIALNELLIAASKKLAQMEQQEGSVEGLGPQVPQLDQGPFPSSNVNSFKYDPKQQVLFVKFHGKDSANSGPIYRYANVPKNIYDIFSQGRIAPRTSGSNRYHTWIKGVTPSLGASLYALIREGGYPYQQVS